MHFTLSLTYTIYKIQDLPSLEFPQIAIAGRSNVGKSSLINRLGGRRNLAHTSSSPGKTRSINFFLVQKEEFYLVDLPGYGYAKRSKQERAKWSALVQAYLSDNPLLQAVVLLLDSKIKPQNLDQDLILYLIQKKIRLLPVLTKIDKCNMSWKSSIQRQWAQILGPGQETILFSAKNGQGTNKLLNSIRQLASQSQTVRP